MNTKRKILIALISGTIALAILSWLFIFGGTNLFQGNIYSTNISPSALQEVTFEISKDNSIEKRTFMYGNNVTINKTLISGTSIQSITYNVDYQINTVKKPIFELFVADSIIPLAGEYDEKSKKVSFQLENVITSETATEFILTMNIPLESNGFISENNRFVETSIDKVNSTTIDADSRFRFDEITTEIQIKQ